MFANKRGLLEGMRESMLRDSKIPELMAEAAGEPDAARRLQPGTLVAQLLTPAGDRPPAPPSKRKA